jgi:cellulose synthase/poly-beta-1,6-N-acetylglucosamine synthase-like glycosyltransferase
MIEPVLTPPVSVIIPIYNGELDLPDLLDCVRSQTYPRDRVEYLLIDNNSQDKTLEILSNAAKIFQKEGLILKVLVEKEIQSSYAARNQGIRQANAEILLFTDVDCRPQPQWVAEMVPYFADPTIGIVVGELEALVGRSLLEQYALSSQMMSQHFLVEHPFCPYGQTANLAIRKVALYEIGLFRPYLTTGGDADICWRIQRETSWKLTTAPRALIYHRNRNNFGDLRRQWKRYGTSNRYLHELHGVPLMRPLTFTEGAYDLVRWLVKDLPIGCIQLLRGKAQPIDLVKTPIDIFNFQSRTVGQKMAKLPENAKFVDRLELNPDQSFGDRFFPLPKR